MSIRTLFGAVVGSLVVATSALAFPGWIGVYGTTVRYNTNANPGAYTILMNQDYVGLNAEVGVQVNGGSWNIFPMSYMGNVDGNSKWAFTPATAYQAGATVKYYFHGWDNWGGHIYDSRNGQNYEFSIPVGASNSLSWEAATQIPVQPGAVGTDIAAYNGSLYAVWGTRSNYYDSALTVWLSKKLPNAAWQPPQLVTTLAGSFATPRLAVAANGLHVLLTDWANLFYLRSENEGQTWFTPVVITNALYPELRADADNAYVIFNRYGAPDTSRIFFTKKANNSSSFTEPTLIFTNSNYKTTVYVKDFDVSGPRMALLAYMQGWYGGYAKFFLHESQDGGATWTGGEQPGANANIALRPATGSLSYITPDTGAGGAGLYFQSKPAGWSSWKQGYANVWAGEGTSDGLRWIDNKLVAISQRNGLRYCSVGSVNMDEVVTWGSPILMDSQNYWAVKDVTDGLTMHLLVAEYGSNTLFFTSSTRSGAVVPVQWIGNTYHWPGNTELDAGDDLWINTETFPKGAMATGEVVYTTDGTQWFSKALEWAGATPANDQWHVNLGKFAAGATLRYALVARDAANVAKWDNNGGQNYQATVAAQNNVLIPIFWGLDPYRFDHEKVRVNGAAGGVSQNFGEFAIGQAISVVTRPVENGNGNSIQTACSITSVLHYTTVSGNWANATAVTGVFHAAGFSNKPIFDYYAYSIGALPAGTKAWFWLEAKNAAGTAYAQTADQNYTFMIAGSSNGDDDQDGLPDQWEWDWIGDLSQNATNNVDEDGPYGRPIANIIEWLTGNNPNVPNDHTGIRLLWSPAYPQPGDTVTLSYFYVNEGNPLFGRPVYGHIGHDGWQEPYDTAMLQPNGAIGRFEINVQAPADATELNVVFHNNAGLWDNNNGQNWRILIQNTNAPASAPASAPTPESSDATTDKSAPGAVTLPTTRTSSTITQAASPSKVAITPSTAATSSARATVPAPAPVAPMKLGRSTVSTAVPNAVNVTIKASGFSDQDVLFAHIGRDGWKQAADVKMKKLATGTFVATYSTTSGQHDINVAFRNGQGVWFTRDGGGWSISIAGNADQTIAIHQN